MGPTYIRPLLLQCKVGVLMSSVYVRDEIADFITAELASETLVDLTGEFENLRDLLARHSINANTPWLGIQYIGNDEIPVDIRGTNTRGKYREIGALYLHVVAKTQVGVAQTLLTRAENIRNTFRGQRIGTILIESVAPPNFDAGATLQFEGGWTSASVIISYQRDLDL